MVNVYCQEKLSEELGFSEDDYSPETADHHWNAERIFFGELGFILMMDDETGYCFLLESAVSEGTKRFKSRFYKAFLNQLLADKVEVGKGFGSSGICLHSYSVNGSADEKVKTKALELRQIFSRNSDLREVWRFMEGTANMETREAIGETLIFGY